MTILVTCLVIIGVLAAIRKGYDARLVLMLAGILLTALAGKPLAVIKVIGNTLGNEEITGPICSAMGYAFVLRAIGADRDLVALLSRPIRHARWLLVPGGCAIGFLTNIAMPSQTATAAAVGPILLPLLFAAGYSRVAAGAILLLGCSIGGNLLNPGDADIVAVHVATGAPVETIIATVLPPLVLALAAAIAVLILVLHQGKHRSTLGLHSSNHEDWTPMTPRRIVTAMLAPLPVIVLFVIQPSLNLFPQLNAVYPNGLPVYSVMFAATFLAMCVTYTSEVRFAEHLTSLTAEFFNGMGYGLSKVISIIIAASCFLAGLNAIGVVTAVSQLLLHDTQLAAMASPIATWLLAMISGSGTAPAVSFAQAVLPAFVQSGQVMLAVILGALASLGANIGRTMSPVSAVGYFVSDLASVEPRELIKVVALPLTAALITVILYGLVSS
jgi:DcuC family C4-dicarboxylate transporter